MDIQNVDFRQGLVDYREVIHFQGNLKALSAEDEARLLESWKDNGNFLPWYVWQDSNSADGHLYALDCHQRIKVAIKHDITYDGGYLVPAIIIDADGEEDARKKLLVMNSNYGKMSREGIISFADGIDMSWLQSHVSFQAFPDLSFIETAGRIANDLEGFQVGDTEYISDGRGYEAPSISSAEYSNFVLVMRHDNKTILVETLNRIRASQGFEKIEDAIMLLVNSYKSEGHE